MTALLNRPAVCPVLIGRMDHLTVLRGLLEQSSSGAGQVILIGGEAGVGKTRLVTETARRAVEMDFQVLHGASFQADGASPYAPLLDMLRRHFAGWPPASVVAALGPSAPIIVPLMPDMLPPSGGRSSLPTAVVVSEKHQLIAAFTQFVVRQAASGPLLLIVEDIHWCDDSSLECLHSLARSCRQHSMVMLLTYRDDEPQPALHHWLAQLDRERLAHEISLRCLPRAEIDAMMRAIFGLSRPVRVEFLDAISDLTEGNSFFIEEVLTSLIAAGDIFYRNGDWDRKPLGEFSIPRSVQDAVLQRAERLTEAARGLLRLAAVIGRRFDFSLLQTLTQLDERQLIELLKELIAGGLLIEDTNDRFACRHALTRQTIYAGLLARERRTMHQAIADALERHVVAPDSYLTDLAHHFYQAGGWEQTLAYAQRAGERAMTLYAPRAAIEQLSHALEAARQLRIPAPAAVVRRRAQAYEWIGEFQAAERDYAAALEQARAADDQETEWQTLHDLGMLWTGREFEHSRDYYQQALDLARAIDQPAMLGHSLNRLGNWHANADQPKEGQRFHDEALSIFQLRGDERGVAATLDLLGITAIMDSDLARAVDCYRQAVKRWEALDQRRELASSLGALAVCGGILHGNTVMAAIPSTEAVREAERGWALAAEIGWRGGESFVQTILGSHLGMRGEYGRALTLVQSAHSIASEIDHRAWIAQAQHVLGGLYLDLLALPEAIEQLEDAFAVARELGSLYRLRSVAGLLASAWIADNQLARAERALDDVLDQDAPFETLGQRPCWHARAELALAREEPDLALTIADRLMATTRNTAGDGQSAVPRLALLRGNALAGLGRPADAERAFRAAIDCSGSQGTRPVLWRAHLALGQLCLGQRRSDDAEPELRAAQAIIQSLADSIDVAAVRDAFLLRAASLLPRPYSGLLHRPAEPTTSALSAREQEVATLIAQGKTNGEIADALFVSKRTIETHVGSILSKLGYTTRAQIIAWVLAAGSVNSSTDGTA